MIFRILAPRRQATLQRPCSRTKSSLWPSIFLFRSILPSSLIFTKIHARKIPKVLILSLFFPPTKIIKLLPIIQDKNATTLKLTKHYLNAMKCRGASRKALNLTSLARQLPFCGESSGWLRQAKLVGNLRLLSIIVLQSLPVHLKCSSIIRPQLNSSIR